MSAAIVGRACILPGALSVNALTELVFSCRSALSGAPAGRFGTNSALGTGMDRTPTDAGGYITGFEQLWNPNAFYIPTAGLDPQLQYLLHCGQEALLEAGITDRSRVGAVFGNLSFPTHGMNAWGEGVLLANSGRKAPKADPRNHFMSGLPADLLKQGLGLGGPCLALDAACASSLYAIAMAMDWLQSGRVDAVLAGAVNASDALFLHVGFHALGAISPTGQSRPFHPEADGLLPGEGCGLVLLKRPEDVSSERVYGIIRGVGLSNDGRARSLLAPSVEGQVVALKNALKQADLTPSEVSYLECHATGTLTGDATERETLGRVYPGLPLGSLKANMGHLITAAGVAGLLKVLGAFERSELPPQQHLGPIIPGMAPFRLVTEPEPWRGRMIAGISAFGFGGNNAHLIVEAPDSSPARSLQHRRPSHRLAVTALGIASGSARHRDEVLAALKGAPYQPRAEQFSLNLEGLRFPPKDLQQALPQQSWLLSLARDTLQESGQQTDSSTGVFIGMGASGSVTGFGLRWRWDRYGSDEDAFDGLCPDAAAPGLKAEHVLGTMPNIPANRLSVQLDAKGPGFTLSAEELSGIRALEAAETGFSNGSIHKAVIGAVELGTEPRLVAALKSLGIERLAADAAVVLVVEPDHGQDCLGRLELDSRQPISWENNRLGCAHAACGLVEVVLALLELHQSGGQEHTVGITSLGGQQSRIHVQKGTMALPTRLASSGTVFSIHSWSEKLPPFQRNHLPAVPEWPLPKTPISGELVTEFDSTDPGPDWFASSAGQLAALHQAFLQSQVDTHRRFLSAYASGNRVLAALAGNEPVILDIPETEPVQAPAILAPPVIAPLVLAPPPVLASPASPPVLAPPLQATSKDRFSPDTFASLSNLPGPKLSRKDLETIASEPVETVFGPEFASITPYAKVVRMPEPPLLLADRVLGIEGPALVRGKGTIWTETDVKEGAWYLEDGRMPPGVLIESGQADLLLISWQGIDTLAKGERVYRLLGCQLQYKRALPEPGDTLQYQICIDGHAQLGGIRMFFFHYDCKVGDELQIQIREGQAGFFTEAELADSGGILWTPEEHSLAEIPLIKGPNPTEKRAFSRAELDAAAAGKQKEAFGPSFFMADPHTASPRMGQTKLLDRVVAFEPEGGPWKRGYLKAELDITPDLWFFNGHFKNDPCMPGTLMFDGCIQAMELYLLALGFGIDRDGWRFEPVKDTTFKLLCRGQVIPSSRRLTYELFIEGLTAAPLPRLRAQVLCTVDGLKCFHADPLEIELVPDWPMTRSPALMSKASFIDAKPVAYDYQTLLACAWGPPSLAFGEMYRRYDGPSRVARLPSPPYHFMSRVLSTTHPPGSLTVGTTIEVEYDTTPPPRLAYACEPSNHGYPVTEPGKPIKPEWYFKEACGVMPFAVLLEAGLQPCGWLASYVGSALTVDSELLFRNLDGKGTLHTEVFPDGAVLKSRVTITAINRSGGMIIENFKVSMIQVKDGVETPLFDFDTVFGFFPPAAFANQVGLPPTDAERAALNAPSDTAFDLTSLPARYFGSTLRLPRGKLRMIDRIAGYWPEGGENGLGRWVAEKDVVPGDWYFKAHFYSDPVQPGSLGIEAMIQLLQLHMIHVGYGKTMKRPRFEGLATQKAVQWRYRGQVVPKDKVVQIELDVVACDESTVTADAWLWVDGRRIYKGTGLCMRVVDDPEYQDLADESPDTFTLSVPADHCPTWVIPAAPMMTLGMTALTAGKTHALKEGTALRWLTFEHGPRTVQATIKDGRVLLSSEGQTIFVATLDTAPEIPDCPEDVSMTSIDTSGTKLYQSGRLFHGPRFQVLDSIEASSESGARSWLISHYPDGSPVPPDVLLDGATHAVPHDTPSRWFDTSDDYAGYPLRLKALILAGSLPQGRVRCELRVLSRKPAVVGAWLFDEDTCIAYVAWEEAFLPKGRVGTAPPEARRAFLQGQPDTGVSLAKLFPDHAELSAAEVAASDWLPGTVQAVFGTHDPYALAAREWVAFARHSHPRRFASLIHSDTVEVYQPGLPLYRWCFNIQDNNIFIKSEGINFQCITSWWRKALHTGDWPGERVILALLNAFLGSFTVEDPAVLQSKVLFLANHETYLESVLFTVIVSALQGHFVRALAKTEHQDLWLGQLHHLLTHYPGIEHPGSIVYFDQADPASLAPLIRDTCAQGSLLAHVEGTRQTTPGQPVEKISSLWVDLCIEHQLPIVPVAFRGGIGDGQKHDTPLHGARQSMHLGKAILPGELAALPYAQRRQRIAQAIDALGPKKLAVGQPELAGSSPAAVIGAAVRLAGGLGEGDAEWMKGWEKFLGR